MLQSTKTQGIFRLNHSGLLGTLFRVLTFVPCDPRVASFDFLSHWPQEFQSSGFIGARPYLSVQQATSAQEHSVGEPEDSQDLRLGKNRRLRV